MTDLFSLKGRVAVVTGASRGLGKAMALALAEAGADIVAAGSSEATVAATAEEIRSSGRECLPIGADMASREQVDALARNAIAWKGHVDVLLNNAGTIRRAPAHEYTDDDWDAVIEINLNSMFRLCRTIGGHMLERGSGKIINVASLLSFSGGITVPAYAASKGGVAQLTKALANEWASKGLQVNAIAPGYFETDNTQAIRDNPDRFGSISARIPAGQWGKPQDLAGPVVFLASPASDYVNGHILLVDGGWMAR